MHGTAAGSRERRVRERAWRASAAAVAWAQHEAQRTLALAHGRVGVGVADQEEFEQLQPLEQLRNRAEIAFVQCRGRVRHGVGVITSPGGARPRALRVRSRAPRVALCCNGGVISVPRTGSPDLSA